MRIDVPRPEGKHDHAAKKNRKNRNGIGWVSTHLLGDRRKGRLRRSVWDTTFFSACDRMSSLSAQNRVEKHGMLASFGTF